MNSLATVEIGKPQKVVSLGNQEDAVLQKLMAFGILPGSQLVVEQRFPSYIISIGRTRTALDQEIAQSIFVESP
ncbi:FeoA family protein [Anabaenopsis elenkinii]|jgi:ferrous iron transport protein A|uniref:Ferrous iron transport protein A n=1 Tax=Anabaenopsis elenkinii CCIBt3563 TaxID=2779889 RepID=A0A7U3NKY3_9CYAN|nr:FeoA family protein [Anabaenopsis elenkinii]QOV21127.1 ferrous iron transport protein A [Anabaenopsis elenkinii CCIBt3563]